METTIVYWGYIRVVLGLYSIIAYIMAPYSLGSILGLYRDNGKEHANYHSILGLYMEKE